ncbi:MAG: hypothetical protein FMNOHCHN_03852 [Ignavibacteriaceae bacterium]|nr:hypothetical protein [Ignavibacteriaceae bacterium]
MIDKNNIEAIYADDGMIVCFRAYDDGIALIIPVEKSNRHFQELVKLAKKEPELINFDFTEYDEP